MYNIATVKTFHSEGVRHVDIIIHCARKPVIQPPQKMCTSQTQGLEMLH